MFDAHLSSESGDTTHLIYDTTSQDHVIEYHVRLQVGAPHFMSHPAKFGGNRHCSSGDITFFACQVISQDHVT